MGPFLEANQSVFSYAGLRAGLVDFLLGLVAFQSYFLGISLMKDLNAKITFEDLRFHTFDYFLHTRKHTISLYPIPLISISKMPAQS
jgi:hypothetical protein